MSKTLSLLLLLLPVAACSGCDHNTGPQKLTTYPTAKELLVPSAFQEGIGLGLYYEHKGRPYEKMFDEMKEAGADHVELVLHWTQKDVRATELKPHPVDTIKDQRLLEAMNAAHERGLKVFLFPIIDVAERKAGEWRGTLKPDSWDKWWESYEAFILYYADLAEKGGAALFSVGSELVSTEEMCDISKGGNRWPNLIRKVRKVFNGKLIYSANWDHYKPVCFWDKLDYIGMTAYYELTKTKEPKYEDLVASWKRFHGEIMEWKAKFEQPLIITEIGYPAQDGTNMHPWDYTTSDPVDLEEQLMCYKAFREVWQNEKRLGGVYFWNWYEPGGPQDKSYTPRGKPAEKVLREWYGGAL